MTERATWSDAEFDMLSWHDNYVHGLQIRGGDHGAGELEPDIDFIVEWVKGSLGALKFRIAAATLTFHDVRDFRIDLDYGAAGAAFESFSISEIRRTPEKDVPGVWQWTVAAPLRPLGVR
jgi:hypothetical protein